jgi:hypothetical protein
VHVLDRSKGMDLRITKGEEGMDNATISSVEARMVLPASTVVGSSATFLLVPSTTPHLVALIGLWLYVDEGPTERAVVQRNEQFTRTQRDRTVSPALLMVLPDLVSGTSCVD